VENKKHWLSDSLYYALRNSKCEAASIQREARKVRKNKLDAVLEKLLKVAPKPCKTQ
jgi:hypothetical protein